MSYVIPPAAPASVPVVGRAERAVHRIYCVGRNYAEHARGDGATGREPRPFFAWPSTVLPVAQGETGHLPTPRFDPGSARDRARRPAHRPGRQQHRRAVRCSMSWGYAVGLDMTRRDLQAEAKKQGRPWCVAKGFDASAPIGPITPAAQAGDVANAPIWLQVNGADRQRSNVSQLIWNIAETIEHLSQAWELRPGDLIFTGTPEGVNAVARSDVLEGGIERPVPAARGRGLTQFTILNIAVRA